MEIYQRKLNGYHVNVIYSEGTYYFISSFGFGLVAIARRSVKQNHHYVVEHVARAHKADIERIINSIEKEPIDYTFNMVGEGRENLKYGLRVSTIE